MNTWPDPDTAWKGGYVWTCSFDAKVAGDWLQKTLHQVHADCSNCSDCQKAWDQLINGYGVIVTLLHDMQDHHAKHWRITTDSAGIDND